MALTEVHDETIVDRTVQLDGHSYTGCTFARSTLVFRGGGPAQLFANTYKQEVKFILAGNALTTVDFLKMLYQHGGKSGQQLVEKLFEDIRGAGE